jgi:hypothetical protein
MAHEMLSRSRAMRSLDASPAARSINLVYAFLKPLRRAISCTAFQRPTARTIPTRENGSAAQDVFDFRSDVVESVATRPVFDGYDAGERIPELKRA